MYCKMPSSLLRCLTASAFFIAVTASATPPTWPTKKFISDPSLQPLTVQTNVTGQINSDYLFIATDGPSAAANGGPLILDSEGNEVYIAHGHAFNFGPQKYRGKEVITWWNGTIFPEPVGRGYGNVLIADNTYQVIANISLPGNFLTLNASAKYASNIDLHEIYITSRDTVLVTANNVTTADLTSVGGPKKGWVVDCQVYEIDIQTNKILFSWKTVDHLDQIPFTASVYPLGTEGFTGKTQDTAWGYFHINSVAPFEDGYIVNSRYTCSFMAIDKRGHVKWRVGGKTGGDFKVASDARFCYEHHVRIIAQSKSEVVVSVHNNANSPLTEPDPTVPSSGLILKVDLETKSVTRVAKYQDQASPIYASAQGSYQGLENDNVLIGHGFVPVVEEYSHGGKIVARTQFGVVEDGQSNPVGGYLSYRAFKAPWIGCPQHPPAVGAVSKAGKTTVAVSWNGATGVEGWVIYAGDSKHSLKAVKEVKKHGFETLTTIPQAAFVQVEAKECSEVCGKHAPKRSAVYAVGSK